MPVVMIVKVKPGTVFSDPITDDDPEGLFFVIILILCFS
jgi:hypothetical protein